MKKTDEVIRYKGGYKYQLVEDYEVQIEILPGANVDTPFYALTLEGKLTIKKGYAWDGPSGTALDTKNFMRGSVVHDVLYQMIREKHLETEHRTPADKVLRRLCREDGMSAIRAAIVFRGLQWFGSPSADPAKDKPVLSAP